MFITSSNGYFVNVALRKLLHKNIKEICVFSRDEKKQENIRIKLKNNKVKFYIKNVKDFKSMNSTTRGLDYVFHTVEIKQVYSF